MIEHPNREDCYIARLLVRKVSPQDSKKYFLAVENIHGEDRYAVSLSVKGIDLIILRWDFLPKRNNVAKIFFN
jgi:hypothetical protein